MLNQNQDAYSEIRSGNRPLSSPYIMYNNLKTCSEIKLFCFVEGKTDEIFYTGFLFTKLGIDQTQIKIIPGSGENAGKKAVISAAEKIIDESKRRRYQKKAIFIVDKDYDDKVIQKTYKIYDKLTILPCYSFENYYFSPCYNLKATFNYVFKMEHVTNRRLDEFETILKDFQYSIAQYCVWKRFCVSNREKAKNLDHYNKDIVEKILENEEISIPFKLPTKVSEFIKEAVVEVTSHELQSFYLLNAGVDDFLTSTDCIKGKILLNLLVKYLLRFKILSKNINEIKGYLYRISELLQVDLNIKQVEV